MTGQMMGGGGDAQFMCGLLQSTLTAKRINTIVAPVWDGPQVRVFGVSLGLGETPESIERLAGALALAAGADSCRVSRDEGRVLLEIPKAEADRRVLSACRLEVLEPPSPTAVAVGIGVHGRVVWHDIASEAHAHTVIGGTTGSGKTVLLRWLLLRLCLQNPPDRLRLLLLDPKGFELAGFRHSAHLLHPVESHPLQVARVLAWVVAELGRRAQAGVRLPRLVVVVEEAADLTAQNRDIAPALERVAQIGRALGVHLVVTTQQPGAASLGRGLANFPARIMGRVASATLTYGATGRRQTGADTLLGCGDFVLLTAGRTTRFQAPLATGLQWGQLPRAGGAVPTLEAELPTLVEFGDHARDPRGGRGGRSLGAPEYRRMEEALAAGARTPDLQAEFGIGWKRARRMETAYREVCDER